MSNIEQISVESRVKLEIVERNMKVFLEIKQFGSEEEIAITAKDISDILTKEGIVFGINNDLIEEITANKKWGEKFVVAEGVYPAPGENARLEFSFPTYKSYKPQIKEDGHIDYHEISIVNSAEKDSVLAKKIDAQLGATGMTVLGHELPAILGKDINIQLGHGVFKDPADNSIIKASEDGIIFYDVKKNYLEIQKLFQVKGSVDFSTGNIHVKSSIEIRGDVNPGFSVQTPYDIQINGSVEQAAVSCDGSLKINKGIVGDGKQIIYAGVDIHAGYINNQHVKCKGNLFASTEIRNSIIECGGEVTIVKYDGVILGGSIFATNKLTAPTIGNKYNVATEIEVGIPLENKEKFDRKKAEIAALYKSISSFNKKIAEISNLARNDYNDKRIIALREESDASMRHLEILKKEIFELCKQGSGKDVPVVIVNKTVYPGTVIKIRHATYEVKEELNHVQFNLSGDEVTTTKIK